MTTVGERAVRLLGDSIRAAVWPTRGEDARWSRPHSRLLRPVPVLTGLYGVIVAIAVSGAVLNERMTGGLAFLALLPLAGALALAPRRPLDAWRIGTAWVVVLAFLLPPPPAPAPGLEVWGWLLWTPLLLLGAWGAPGRTTLGVAVVSGLAVVVLVVATPADVPLSELGLTLSVLAFPLGAGAALGARWDTRRALEVERRELAAAQAERGALAERARIAREMHDVVAHHMSMIAVRCETAPYRLGRLPAPARAELAEVATAAREALREMQGLLGVLRTGETERTPQPGLADIEPLLVEARSAGVELTWEIVEAEVPAPVGLTAFRIVAQGLANARQHAPGAPVHVAITDGLVVEIVNGRGTGPGTPGGGTGIPSMRERAEVHGGTLDAGPTADGFRLRAELPR
ncbi:sensor histidine kinase [Pseudonocardia sp. WMMC193]|uniref:sensor histidine kinase n=1 Tax=Pseudonocardia sp. WMMC193 TaxID=2911965 RepID=UPI001EFFF4AA|nr:histidine kinase [Pseudonocardia sp. WMMC193]MCF7548132.1 histidine kinase [Pseudonocardia sp. WMMC193]